MAYLNANIPPTYAQIRKGVSYMILKNIMEKLKTVLSLVLACLTGPCYIISCYYGKRCNILSLTN